MGVKKRERLERAFIWDSSTEVDWEEEEEGATPPPEERVAEREGCCRSAITSNNFSTLDEREGEQEIESQSGTVLTEWGEINDNPVFETLKKTMCPHAIEVYTHSFVMGQNSHGKFLLNLHRLVKYVFQGEIIVKIALSMYSVSIPSVWSENSLLGEERRDQSQR